MRIEQHAKGEGEFQMTLEALFHWLRVLPRCLRVRKCSPAGPQYANDERRLALRLSR